MKHNSAENCMDLARSGTKYNRIRMKARYQKQKNLENMAKTQPR